MFSSLSLLLEEQTGENIKFCKVNALKRFPKKTLFELFLLNNHVMDTS